MELEDPFFLGVDIFICFFLEGGGGRVSLIHLFKPIHKFCWNEGFFHNVTINTELINDGCKVSTSAASSNSKALTTDVFCLETIRMFEIWAIPKDVRNQENLLETGDQK